MALMQTERWSFGETQLQVTQSSAGFRAAVMFAVGNAVIFDL